MPTGAQAAPHPVRPRRRYSSSLVLPNNISNNNSSLVTSYVYIVVVVVLSLWLSGASAQDGNNNNNNEAEALLKFKKSLENADSPLSNWNPSKPPCSKNNPNWNGVLCTPAGHVLGLQLENMKLKGKIDVEALVPLESLRALSFKGNQFEGEMPDWRKLGALKALYLSDNQFSGEISEDAFRNMTSLKKVEMANNKFTGPIPQSLESPKLSELRLENNQFTGEIPPISADHLKVFNVSNNQLEGPIPKPLLQMDKSSFAGNKELCGEPLGKECKNVKSPPPTTPAGDKGGVPPGDNTNNGSSPPSSSSSSGATIAIIVTCVVVGLFIFLMVGFLLVRKRRMASQAPQLGRAASPADEETIASAATATAATSGTIQEKSSCLAAAAAPAPAPAPRKSEQPGKLSFVREDREKFDLQDLMRASAEVLGSGNFGASYKAVLVDGEALVVKRFKQMNSVAREDFHEHMRRLGRLKHQNLLPLVAYLYRKEEKLLVFDYVHNGSLATHLHGNHTAEKPGLSWATRLKIIKGVAKGMIYLRNELPSLTVPHGHLKSSNVLLDKEFNPLLMDYALMPVVKSSQAHQILVAFKSPEYATAGQVSKKTDVWCLGILILETLTGKYVAQGSGTEVLGWINAIAGEEIRKVFDPEMEITDRAEAEKLLRIGVYCCQEAQDKRWDLDEAVQQIDQVQESSPAEREQAPAADDNARDPPQANN